MNYTLTRSNRKTLAIHIKPDGMVEVRAPLRLAKSEIERFIASKTDWIKKKQEQIAARQTAEPRELPSSPYAPGEFEQTVRELIEQWEQRLGVTASFIGLRVMTSRWGSCTAKTRRIRLNTALSYCPRECLEYVVVHELTHLRESNHSPRFWAIVSGALPDYKARQKELKTLAWLFNADGGKLQSSQKTLNDRRVNALRIAVTLIEKELELKSELTKIPGIGENMAEHLIKAGFPTIDSLKGKNPDDIYAADCIAQGMQVDRCALYCYRLAVHYADHNGQLPEDKTNWWNWKD